MHYTVDEKQKAVLLTEDGYEAVEDVLQVRWRREALGLEQTTQNRKNNYEPEPHAA